MKKICPKCESYHIVKTEKDKIRKGICVGLVDLYGNIENEKIYKTHFLVLFRCRR